MSALRHAGPADAAFLKEVLAVAFDWRGTASSGTLAASLQRPDIAHYLEGWPRPDDHGIVAEGEAGTLQGAAWWRFLPAEDPGYGFVAPDVPELTLGVLPDHRGRGVGTALLGALVDDARTGGIAALSLSVERENAARRLYARMGFDIVGGVGGSDTMLLALAPT